MLGTDMRAECLLLEPVNITVNITRNLAASWYHGHPAVDICGNLESFSVSVLSFSKLKLNLFPQISVYVFVYNAKSYVDCIH